MQNNIGSTDTVNARLTPGEFVIKKSAVDTIGLPLLRKLNNLPEEGGHDNIDELIAMANMVGAQAMPMGGEVTPNYQGGGITGYQEGDGVTPQRYAGLVERMIKKFGGEVPEGMYTPEGGMTRAGYAKLIGADPESVDIDTLAFTDPANYKFKISGKGKGTGVDVGGITKSMGMLPLETLLGNVMRENIEDPFERMDWESRLGEVSPYQSGGPVGYQNGDLVGPPAPPQLQQGPPQLRQMPPQGQQGQQGPQQSQTYRDSMGVWNEAFMKNQQSKQNNLRELAIDSLNEVELKRMVDSLMLEAEGAGRIRRLDESPRHLYNDLGQRDLGQRPPGSI